MTALRHLRFVAFLEGLSFVVLLFVAMPLKYFAGLPVAVRITGGVHGFLFVTFVFVLARAAVEHKWSIARSLTAFGSSLVPFGTFVFDRSLRAEMAETKPIGTSAAE